MTDPNTSTAAHSSSTKKSKTTAKKTTTTTTTHPKFSVMIKEALTQLNDRNGTSKAAILKYILSNYKVNYATVNQHLKLALRAGTKNQTLKQTKGVGASGSFKLPAKAPAAAAAAAKKKKTSTPVSKGVKKSPARTSAKKKTTEEKTQRKSRSKSPIKVSIEKKSKSPAKKGTTHITNSIFLLFNF